MEIINAAMNAAAIVERPDIRMNGTEGLDPSLAGLGGMICDQGDRSDVGPGQFKVGSIEAECSHFFAIFAGTLVYFAEVTCWP